MHNPTDLHWSAAKRILGYLKHTLNHCLFLYHDTSFRLQAFLDADWAIAVQMIAAPYLDSVSTLVVT